MTGEVNEKYLTPQERQARQMVKAVNEASPRDGLLSRMPSSA